MYSSKNAGRIAPPVPDACALQCGLHIAGVASAPVHLLLREHAWCHLCKHDCQATSGWNGRAQPAFDVYPQVFSAQAVCCVFVTGVECLRGPTHQASAMATHVTSAAMKAATKKDGPPPVLLTLLVFMRHVPVDDSNLSMAELDWLQSGVLGSPPAGRRRPPRSVAHGRGAWKGARLARAPNAGVPACAPPTP